MTSIVSNVIFPSMACATLSSDTKESILRKMVIIQNMKTSDEICDFCSGALQSSKGHKVYKSCKEQNLITVEGIRDKVNEAMNDKE